MARGHVALTLQLLPQLWMGMRFLLLVGTGSTLSPVGRSPWVAGAIPAMELSFPTGKPSPSSFQRALGLAGDSGRDVPVPPVPTASQTWEQGQWLCMRTHTGDTSLCQHCLCPQQCPHAGSPGTAGREDPAAEHVAHLSRPGEVTLQRQEGPGGTRSTSATPRGTSGWRAQPGQSPWRGGKVS